MTVRYRYPSWFSSVARIGLALALSVSVPAEMFNAIGRSVGNFAPLFITIARAQEPYAESVVAKADEILKNAGLRRSGKTLQATDAAELSRELSSLNRERRELRLQQTEFQDAEKQLAVFDQNLAGLNRTDRNLNLQLAQVAGTDVAGNNRIVAMINATRSQVVETRRLQTAHAATIRRLRGELNNAEQAYSEKIFQARKMLDELHSNIDKSFADPQFKIALDVMHRNFEVPSDLNSSQVLRSLENRLVTFEEEVFQDSIDLEVGTNGSLFAMVSVNNQPIRMVVDSGATLITIPANTAKELNLDVPADAKIVNLALANGQRITARRIQLASVRVGEFEATEVDAVVLEPIAGSAQPLLGLSYLNRYKFELNPTAKTLGLLRIQQAP